MRVLVAHDGSSGAEVATSLAASLPWPDGSVIRVIGVMEGDLRPLLATEPAPRLAQPAPLDLAAALEVAASTLQRPGVAVEPVLRRGDPATAVADEAQAFGAHLVVIGSRGLGPVRSVLLGSVAAAVVDAAPCPVLVARTPIVHKVLLATDGSGTTAAATEALVRWPIFAGMSIQVLSVATAVPQYGDPPAGSGMHEAVETARHLKVADAAAIRLLTAGLQATAQVRTGDAAAQIVSVAEAGSIDLIVVGSRGRTGLKRAVLGSVGRAVLTSTRGSVLIIKPLPVAEDPTGPP